ncbi:hypothetical protein CDL12_27358 [Handroanthus impetiginosus]|uniref:Pentacotripeptide-repeat region of PRORP domain-containing protein n=1 Tax=Handroanthus impetiginosus TaxID=429701 RepID=A0A2G9G490_9LAMI|nr:hypothetical protein CDL12_27358 [Handroanthus impetiginosus]
MRKPTFLLTAFHLRKLLLRCFSTKPNSLRHHLSPSPPPSSPAPQLHHLTDNNASSVNQNTEKIEEEKRIAECLSSELLKSPDAEPLPLPQRLDISFSHLSITPALILATLNIPLMRAVPELQPRDEVYSYFVDYFGRRKDFKADHNVLLDGRVVVGSKSFEALVDRLVRADRPTQTVALFERMEKDYGFVRNMNSLKFIVSSLCERGHASYAEKMFKSLANEVKRLVCEMHWGGFEIGTYAYNATLACVCWLCRKKDPFWLQTEAENVLIDMERNGVPRDVETFNVLITSLCWTGWRSDEMIDRMKSAGYGDALDKKAYYEFLKILCGIERIDHATGVFAKMKEDGREPGIKTYNLMGKLCAHGRLDKANVLYREAESKGVPVELKAYRVDPRFVKKEPKVVKKEKKRETLPEKMARKRRTLRKITLSFVKKPKRVMRRAY